MREYRSIAAEASHGEGAIEAGIRPRRVRGYRRTTGYIDRGAAEAAMVREVDARDADSLAAALSEERGDGA